jgi:methionyl aminopeptidase
MNLITNLLFPKTKTTTASKSTRGLPALNNNRRGIHLKSAAEIEKMRQWYNLE